MPKPPKTAEELIAFFAAKATAPPPESSRMLVRHFQCKESLELSRILVEAIDRYATNDSQQLVVPSELLPPLA